MVDAAGRAGSVSDDRAVGVAGAGAWGAARANAAAAAGRRVALWGRDPERMAEIEASRRTDNPPGVRLAPAVRATGNIDELAACEAILVATPAQETRQAAHRLAALGGTAPLEPCAKGIAR